MDYSRHLSGFGIATPPTAPIPGAGQVKNSAGGYVFQVDDWDRLARFLILGTEGGTYYASEQSLTRDNAAVVERCLARDGARVVRTVVEISESGRAPKNDPAIFALAMVAKFGDKESRRAAHAAMPKVCRIGTHLFQYVEAVNKLGGFGRGTRRSIEAWYNTKDPDDLAYQLLKYQQRNGWSHRDVLRLAHVRPATDLHSELYKMAIGQENAAGEQAFVAACEELKKLAPREEDLPRVCQLIVENRLPREVIPTELLNVPEVWEALLVDMPMTAMIRNLATMTRVGLIKPLSDGLRTVTTRLGDESRLRKARVHPIGVLSALRTYAQGHGERSKHTWQPVGQVVDALDAAFYASFGFLEPSGAATLLGLDVSASMDGGVIAGVAGLAPRLAAAAMAMVTARVEKHYGVVAFSTNLTVLSITPQQRLDDVVRITSSLPFGGTNCALPMLAAAQEGWKVDTFVVYTDNETWAGDIHPSKALELYRQKTGRPAKLCVVGLTSTGFSIADPRDAGMMDVVGFDTSAPQLIADFSKVLDTGKPTG